MRAQVNIQSNEKTITIVKIYGNKKKTQPTAKKKSVSINKEKDDNNRKTQKPYLEK